MLDRKILAIPTLLASLFVGAAGCESDNDTDRRDRSDRLSQRDRLGDRYRGDIYDRDRRNGRGRRDGYLNDYERRALRDSARRLENRSQSFQRNLDRNLDRSRHDDTRREDNINNAARDFRSAADRFRNEAGDSSDPYRSRDEARQLLQSAARVERSLRRVRLDSRTANDWAQIRSDLRTVADIYGLRQRDYDYDDGYGRGRGRNGYPW